MPPQPHHLLELVARWGRDLNWVKEMAPDDPAVVELQRRIARYEDGGHGFCWLARPDIARLVENALLHFDGARYRLLAWCVMPNHVHALLETLEGFALGTVAQGWKSFTAKVANRALGRGGAFCSSFRCPHQAPPGARPARGELCAAALRTAGERHPRSEPFMRALVPFLLASLFAATPGAAAQKPPVRVTTLPGRVLIAPGEFDQRLNFDFILENPGGAKLTVDEIELSAYAQDGSLVALRRVGTNGDSISVIGNRTVEPGSRLVVFNPFHSFPPDVSLARLAYVFTFSGEGGEPAGTAAATVEPAVYRTKTDLAFPVGGRVVCWDGPDLYGHHRRIDITGGMTTALGITANFMRYGYDFSVVDAQGRMFKGTGERNEDWYGFGTPIYATGDGVVAVAGDGIPDNTTTKRHELTREAVMANPHVLFGNHVAIDHGNGEVSYFAHMKQGSVRVKAGDRVKRGQQIGEMGFSGDAITVHLHYQLQSDTKWGEGVPTQFKGLRRWAGGRWVPLASGVPDSGDVLQGR